MVQSSAPVDLVFHALSDKTRRDIVKKLSRGPVSVSQLAAPLHITVTAVTQHLQVLERSGLVRTKKLGRVRTCTLEPKGFSPLESWVQNCRQTWERRLDRLGTLLDELEEQK